MSRGAFNGYKVAEAWIYGHPANSGSFRTDGHNIWTYGVLLAHKGMKTNELVLDVPEDWRNSPTSTKHFNIVKLLRDKPDYCVMMADHIRSLDHQPKPWWKP